MFLSAISASAKKNPDGVLFYTTGIWCSRKTCSTFNLWRKWITLVKMIDGFMKQPQRFGNSSCVRCWFSLQWWRRFCRSLVSRASVTGQQLLSTRVCFILSLSAARWLARFQSHLSVFKLWFHFVSFTPTKVPNVRYELGGAVSPAVQSRSPAVSAQVALMLINSVWFLTSSSASSCWNVISVEERSKRVLPANTGAFFLLQVSLHRDFSAARDQAGKMIQTAFALLDQEFQKLERSVFPSQLPLYFVQFDLIKGPIRKVTMRTLIWFPVMFHSWMNMFS